MSNTDSWENFSAADESAKVRSDIHEAGKAGELARERGNTESIKQSFYNKLLEIGKAMSEDKLRNGGRKWGHYKFTDTDGKEKYVHIEDYTIIVTNTLWNSGYNPEFGSVLECYKLNVKEEDFEVSVVDLDHESWRKSFNPEVSEEDLLTNRQWIPSLSSRSRSIFRQTEGNLSNRINHTIEQTLDSEGNLTEFGKTLDRLYQLTKQVYN